MYIRETLETGLSHLEPERDTCGLGETLQPSRGYRASSEPEQDTLQLYGDMDSQREYI